VRCCYSVRLYTGFAVVSEIKEGTSLVIELYSSRSQKPEASTKYMGLGVRHAIGAAGRQACCSTLCRAVCSGKLFLGVQKKKRGP